MKLKIKSDRLRVLSEFYGYSLQKLARMAANAWSKAGNEFDCIDKSKRNRDSDGKIIPDDTAVIDVSDDYTPQEWREMIYCYAEREFAKLPEVLEFAIKVAKRSAQVERENLPKYTETK